MLNMYILQTTPNLGIKMFIKVHNHGYIEIKYSIFDI